MSVSYLIKRFLPYLWPVRWLVAGTIAFLLISPLLSIAFLKLGAMLMDKVFIGGAIDLLPWFIGASLFIQVVKFISNRVEQRVDLLASERISIQVKADLFKSVISMSPTSAGAIRTGEVISHLSSDVSGVEYIIYSGMIGLIDNVARVFVYGALLIFLSVKLTLAALFFLPFLMIASTRNAKPMKRIARIMRRKRAAAMGTLEERLNARPLVVAYGMEQSETESYIARANAILKGQLWSLGVDIRLKGFFDAVSMVAGATIMSIGALEVHAHHMTTGSLFAYLASMGSLYGPAKSLAKAWGRFQRAGVSAERVATLMDRAVDTNRLANVVVANDTVVDAPAIAFENVSFAYGEQRVLDNVSFTINAGERVAVVGASGAGKTTLLRLVLGFCTPTAGRILVDGLDARTVAPEELRRRMAMVFQEPYLFRATVADNVRYGAPAASGAEIETALRRAQAMPFVAEMPHGIRTKIAVRGGSLSGGQQQRLGLARAFARDAEILLLDEPTSALDGQTEALLNDALLTDLGGKTVVTVTHRLSTVMVSDRVILMEGGRVVEDGRPADLLAVNTRCRNLFESQLETWKMSA